MELDWFTVTAQIVNFLILVVLLQRFLYRPLVEAVRRRERAVRERLDHARRIDERARADAERVAAERASLDDERERRIAETREEVRALRAELEERVRAEIRADRERWLAALRRERDEALAGLRERLARQITEIARRVLRDLADAELEERVVTVFADRLRSMPTDDWRAMRAGAGEGSGPVEVAVRSSFTLDEGCREWIGKLIEDGLGDASVRFDEEPEMICGIELRTHGRKIAWSIADRLQRLEDELLAEHGATAGTGVDRPGSGDNDHAA